MNKGKWFSIVFSILLLLTLGLTSCSPGLAQIGGVPPAQKAAALPAASDNNTPKDFASTAELLLWLGKNGVSDLPPVDNAVDWFNKARMVQADALADGYIVNIDYDYSLAYDTYKIYNTAVIDGNVYFWDPESDNVTQDHGLSGIRDYFR